MASDFGIRNLDSSLSESDALRALEPDLLKSPTSTAFYDNLAKDCKPNILTGIGFHLAKLIESDKRSRSKRDDQYAESLRRTGLSDDAPGGATFTGASKVVHPMLTSACVDFAARSMKELWPAQGPVRSKILGKSTEADFARSKRIETYLNYQLAEQIPGFRSEVEQLLTQLPLSGACYLKLSYQAQKKRPCVEFIAVDDIYLPYAASNFSFAERRTHVQYITELELQTRIDSGQYIDMELGSAEVMEQSKSSKTSDRIEGREMEDTDADQRTIYECFCAWDLSEIDKKADGIEHYIITIDASSEKVLSIYRNWEEEDEKRLELAWIVEFPFMPWRGAFPIGLGHMINGLSAAATGSLRALLDSALINNFPGLLKLKGGSAGGATERVDPTQIMEIEGSMGGDDIRKHIAPLPYNSPSPILLSLLGFLVDSASGVLKTTMENNSGASSAPVGTTMARLEQGLSVYAAIHSRLHASFGNVIQILYRINKFYLDEKEVFDENGKLLAKRVDFEGPMTVVPVSDSHIFSDLQRYAQVQVIAARAQSLPQLYNLRKVEELILERMKIADKNKLLRPPQEAIETNAVNENIASTMGRPILAFPEQDHEEHIKTHLAFIQNKGLASISLIGKTAIPLLLSHIKDHVVLWYAQKIFEKASEAAGVDISTLQKDAQAPERAAFDRMLAQASPLVMSEITDIFAGLPQVIEEAQKMLAQFGEQDSKNAPPDTMMILAQAKIASEEKIAMQKAELEKMKSDNDFEAQKNGLMASFASEKAQFEQASQERMMALRTQELKHQIEVQIDNAKLSEQSRQAGQVMELEAMKEQAQTDRVMAELDNAVWIEQLREEQAAEIVSLKAAQAAELAAIRAQRAFLNDHL